MQQMIWISQTSWSRWTSTWMTRTTVLTTTSCRDALLSSLALIPQMRATRDRQVIVSHLSFQHNRRSQWTRQLVTKIVFQTFKTTIQVVWAIEYQHLVSKDPMTKLHIYQSFLPRRGILASKKIPLLESVKSVPDTKHHPASFPTKSSRIRSNNQALQV